MVYGLEVKYFFHCLLYLLSGNEEKGILSPVGFI
jgi:hypothetical protein